ncbi:MAG: PilZ domain-containing protein [Candidatus Igneacidithiobacillus chanchocoensis]
MAGALWQGIHQEFFREPFAISGDLRRTRLLQELKAEHQICDLLLPNDAEPRMSLVVDFSVTEGWVAMDSPPNFPASAVGLDLLVQSRPSQLPTVWESRLREVRDDLLYIEFPEVIYQKQARRLYRVMLAIDDPQRIELYRTGAPMVLGEILDISEGGTRVRQVGRAAGFSLHSGERLPKVFFSMRDGVQISCPATVRHFVPGQDGIGLEFTDIDPAARRAIAKYVFDRDREIARAQGIELGGHSSRKSGVWSQFKRWISS